jgi:MFS family permease
MAFGSLVCFVCGFLYPVLASISGFLFLRLLHGFSTGFKPTATAAYVADIAPPERWGEAMGIHGLCFSIGMAIGPALGGFISLHYSLDVLFYTSSAFALLSILILMNMKETLQQKQKFRPSLLKINRNNIIAVEVLPAGIITLLSYLSYGVILTLIPDWTGHLGIANKGMFFVVFTLASLVVRFVAGRASDRYGRTRVITIGLGMLLLALVIIGYTDTPFGMLLGAGVYGVAQGVLSPALNAWTVDMSHPEHRGKAMATMYIALEAGIGLGAVFAGWYYADVITRVPLIFYTSAGFVTVALLYMLLRKKVSVSNT